MRSRRPLLILLVAGILMLGALSAAERDRGPVAVAPSGPAVPADRGEEISVTLPSTRPLKVRAGDTVVLRVRSDAPDIAKVLAVEEHAPVGAQVPVGPDLPGELRFVARVRGEFEVRLELAGTRAGLVEVS